MDQLNNDMNKIQKNIEKLTDKYEMNIYRDAFITKTQRMNLKNNDSYKMTTIID